MRPFLLFLVLTAGYCLSIQPAIAQQATISGSGQVQVGDVDVYSVTSWPNGIQPTTGVTWTVMGGTVLSSDPAHYTCRVQWQTNGYGYVEVADNTSSTTGELDVLVGNVVDVDRIYVPIYYGVTPPTLNGTYYSSLTPLSMEWDQSFDNGNTWASTGVTTTTFTPPSTVTADYRFLVNFPNGAYPSLTIQAVLQPLNAGGIVLNNAPAYNTIPVIGNSPATGGTAAPSTYIYTWEASVDGQPWMAIGSGQNYPGVAIVGKTAYRRDVTCNGQTASSNVIYATPSYTSVDYENLNYVRTIDVHVPGITTWDQADQLPIASKDEMTVYLDGLGRPIQKVGKSASLYNGAWSDLVIPFAYDQAGRTTQRFMPYPTTDNPGKFKSVNVASEQSAFVTSKFGEPAGAPTYSQISYDNSPFNRVTKTTAPGQSWGGSGVGIATNYDFNMSGENVHIWNLDYYGNIPTTTSSQVYATGTLFKTTTTDESGNRVINYTDLSGHVILKKAQEADPGSLSTQHAGWACTYYVYDDLDQLRYVITPKAVEYLDNNNWVLTQQLVNDLCYVYTFDAKGREISKKQPGAGVISIVYDQNDHPVFTQDANGAAKNQWLTNLYDGLDRVTSTGVMTTTMNQAALQNAVNTSTGNLTLTKVTTLPGQADISVTGTLMTSAVAVASHSITITNFNSNGQYFYAYINPNSGNTVNEAVAIADVPIPAGVSNVVLTQKFYDDYSHATKAYSTADNSLFSASTIAQTGSMPSNYSKQTRGLATGSKVKVLSNGSDPTQGSTWLETDTYYDAFGRIIQLQNDNYVGGTDVVSDMLDFQGKSWGSCVKHMAGSPSQFTLVSQKTYDLKGQLTDLSENFNGTFFKDLASYSYDEYGELVSRQFAPGYPGPSGAQLETQNYTRNIRGWLTGINKDYALSTDPSVQWSHYFGMSLGYDNADNEFNAAQLDGKITGTIWKSQGDNSMRKYDYTYDHLRRFTSGLFNQRASPSDGWSNGTVDLSEYVGYADANGNIGSMKHMGIVPGVTGGIPVDDLGYNYGNPTNTNVNVLTRVDEHASFTGNGQLNDFKDGSNASGSNDYNYDNNGNLVQDLNKGITDGGTGGISYNFLNKPVQISIPGKLTIQYIYDASGVKLSKVVTDMSVTPNTTTTTNYDNEFVYQNNALQYVLHDEGRLNLINPISTPQKRLDAGTHGANVLPGTQGTFEYFVKDHLSNVRMVLTEETQQENYMATMETSSASDPNLAIDEEKLFGKVDPSTGNPTPDNEVILTRGYTPSTWTGNTSQQVCDLTAAGNSQTIGPNMLLQVSAGDTITTGVNYFYYTNDATGPTSYTGSDILTALSGALLAQNVSSIAELNTAAIKGNLGASTSNFSNFATGTYKNPTGPPNAFLNVLYFDQQFNFIPPDPSTPGIGTAVKQVTSNNNQTASMTLQQKAPKNGWAFVYLSNESNENVYFDNLAVQQAHGNISEETHYYAFGQKIAGIGSTGFQKLPSKYHYQGSFSEEEENTEWNEFDLRMYDPQVGRWTRMDPYDQFASPFVGMGNDPVSNVDENGGFLYEEGAIVGAVAGGIAAYMAADNNSKSKGKVTLAKIGEGLAGALVGSGIGYSIEASISADVNKAFGGSPNLWQNFKAYYIGILGLNNLLNAGWDVLIDPRGNNAYVPNIWGSGVGDIVIPPLVEEQYYPILSKVTVGGLAKITDKTKNDIKPGGNPAKFNFPPPPNNQKPQITLHRDIQSTLNQRTTEYDLDEGDANMRQDERTFFQNFIQDVRSSGIQVRQVNITLDVMESQQEYNNGHVFTNTGSGASTNNMQQRIAQWQQFIQNQLGGGPIRFIINPPRFKQKEYNLTMTIRGIIK